MTYQHMTGKIRCEHGEAALCQALDKLSLDGWDVLTVETHIVSTGNILVPGQRAAAEQAVWWIVARRPLELPTPSEN